MGMVLVAMVAVVAVAVVRESRGGVGREGGKQKAGRDAKQEQCPPQQRYKRETSLYPVPNSSSSSSTRLGVEAVVVRRRCVE